MANPNKVNNELSEAVLAADCLGALLSELGCDVQEVKGILSFRGPCPVHLGDGSNFQVNTHGHTLPIYWTCHSRKCHNYPPLKRSLLGLVRGALTHDRDRPASLKEAQQFVTSFLAGRGTRPVLAPRRENPPQPRRLPNWPRELVRRQLEVPSPYFVERGFDPDVLDRFDIGDSAKQGRAIIPIYGDSRTACIGYVSRSVKPYCGRCKKCHPTEDCRLGEARWLFPTSFASSEWLYNLAGVRQSDAPFVLLVEGVPDVLRATEAGVPAVAVFGNDISVEQTQKLAALGKDVIVAFDNDRAGVEGGRMVTSILRREGVKAASWHPPAAFKDVGEMSAPAVTQWLASMTVRPTVADRTWISKQRKS